MGKKSKRRKTAAKELAVRHSVFISHATHDKWIAKVLCEKTEELGVTTFRDDRDIEGGDSIPTAIRDEIRSCQELLVLLTPGSVGREWIVLEIGMAFAFDCRIVPLVYHIDAHAIPAIIRDNRGFSLENLDDYLADLRKRAFPR